MSGRSAYVRKAKTKVKDQPAPTRTNGSNTAGGHGATHQTQAFVNEDGSEKSLKSQNSPSLLGQFPLPVGYSHAHVTSPEAGEIRINHDLSHVRTGTSSSSELGPAYARVRRPRLPDLEVSGIEKSSFRALMDRKSENIRLGLARTFGKKKGNGDEPRTETAMSGGRPESSDSNLDPPEIASPSNYTRPFGEPEFIRQGPPQIDLPPIPIEGQMKKWSASGRSATQWNKIRKDPELWDPSGDTLVFLGSEHEESGRHPSFRIWSHVIESCGSKFLLALLREGEISELGDVQSDHSDPTSPTFRAHPGIPSRQFTKSPAFGSGGSTKWDSSLTYKMYFPAENARSKEDVLAHQMTTRNVFAYLLGKSIVGFSFYQAVTDLQTRMEEYWTESEDDPVLGLLKWIEDSGLHDCRNDPAKACALLSWSEEPEIGQELFWKEAYVHAAGMFPQCEKVEEMKLVENLTKRYLRQAHELLLVRIARCEDLLGNFSMEGLWPEDVSGSDGTRGSFKRVLKFFFNYHKEVHGSWPPSVPAGFDTWVTRRLVKQMEGDFGSLYNYIVDRDVLWDSHRPDEEIGWSADMNCKSEKSFLPDNIDLPLTRAILAFDNANGYPHIPHPYPLVPAPNPTVYHGSGSTKKMAERVAAVSYSSCTNMDLMPSNFTPNALVEAFLEFEKKDFLGEADPHAARRARWLAIYGILQVLASLSPDASQMAYTDGVDYFLSSPIKRDPFADADAPELTKYGAAHHHSYCWTIRSTWKAPFQEPKVVRRRDRKTSGLASTYSAISNLRPMQISGAPSIASSDAGSSLRSGTLTNASSFTSQKQPQQPMFSRQNKLGETALISNTGYTAGIEKLPEEWPMGDPQEQQQQQQQPHQQPRRKKASYRLTPPQAHASIKENEPPSSPENNLGSPRRERESKNIRVKVSSKEFVIKDFDDHDAANLAVVDPRSRSRFGDGRFGEGDFEDGGF